MKQIIISSNWLKLRHAFGSTSRGLLLTEQAIVQTHMQLTVASITNQRAL